MFGSISRIDRKKIPDLERAKNLGDLGELKKMPDLDVSKTTLIGNRMHKVKIFESSIASNVERAYSAWMADPGKRILDRKYSATENFYSICVFYEPMPGYEGSV